MFSRRLRLALVLAVPSVLLGWRVKAASGWEPVALGQISTYISEPPAIETSEEWVLIDSRPSDGNRLRSLFNTQANTLKNEAVAWPLTLGVEGKYSWSLEPHPAKTSRALSFTLAFHDGDGHERKLEGKVAETPGTTNGQGNSVYFLHNQDQVVLKWNSSVVRWRFSSGQQQSAVLLSGLPGDASTLSRDTQTVIVADDDHNAILFLSATTGRQKKRVRLQGFSSLETQQLSHFGSFALYDQGGGVGGRYIVADTNTGRALWKFDLDSYEESAVLSNDEKLIFLPLSSRKIWQVRDLKTGKIIRTLPLAPNIQAAAVSPDGDTLYFVANGTLYRQRAR